MFQRLDELQTGSLYILTGQAGAGKSHLAASARKGGTLWVLDTEGAAQNLSSKPGIHRRIQVVRRLPQAIEKTHIAIVWAGRVMRFVVSPWLPATRMVRPRGSPVGRRRANGGLDRSGIR